MANTGFIDLTTGNIRIEVTDPGLLEKFLGGRGYASRLLYDLVSPEIAPLSPENLLIFSMGPMGGSPWPTSSRGHVTFKSPVTGAYGHANSGGFFGAELYKAGYDALVVKGKASHPVYLYVTDDHIEIRPADDLWGMEVSLTTDALEHLGKVACIGPAGENLVNISAIMNDRDRAASRSGPGAVMGSKLLKAVVIQAKGKQVIPEGYLKKVRSLIQHMSEHPFVAGLKRYGTSTLVEIQNSSGALPSRNHQRVQIPFVEKVGGYPLDKYVLHGKGCHACPVRCGRVTEVPSGEYACKTGGPEYESLSALAPMTWNSNLEAAILANLRCNELGLDTISTGVTIAFAMECAEKGLLKDEDFSLAWGDERSELGLIEKIAHRQGIGNILADGTRLAASAIGGGAEKFAMQVKGLELPRQDPRVAKGFGLAHAVGNRGADHLYALPTIDSAGLLHVAQKFFPADIVDELMETLNEKYKPDLVIHGEHYCAVVDSLGICKLVSAENYATMPDDLAEGLSELQGRKVTAQELLAIGERIVNLERLYNARHGMGRKDDYLPERFMKEPVNVYEYTPNPETGWGTPSEKPIKENCVIQDLDAMLDRYYSLRGWSKEGIPTQGTLERLGLA